jgi:predicted nucleic acid-binding protein
MILVDSSVLIDVIEGKPEWSEWSVARLFECSTRDTLAINVVIYAEISRSFADTASENKFLQEAGIILEAISPQAAFMAARAHMAYRTAGGSRLATLPDFFIGAHAQAQRHSLLTRDPVRIQTYFPAVHVICP